MIQENKTYFVALLDLKFGGIQSLYTGEYYTQPEAIKRADKLNETCLAECKSLGYDNFVVMNKSVEYDPRCVDYY